MDAAVEVVVEAKAELGEGPVWDADRGVLWWLDILGCAVHHFDPRSGDDVATPTERPVGALALRRAGGLVLATPRGLETFDPDTAQTELLVAGGDEQVTRMNDGKCDSRGRMWAGTMAYDAAEGAGTLYCFGVDHQVRPVVTDVTISNGLAWSADDTVMYYIDSTTGRVDAFEFDVEGGELGARRPVAEIPEDAGLPDGMTIDAEGCLWVALYGGGGVRRYTPDGTLDGFVPVPARNVTSCTFGGPDLDVLYITTARGSEDDGFPAAGSVFACRPGVRGRPTQPYGG